MITARCDVEQDKFPVLNYLPVVPFDDWLVRDGFDILHARLTSENEAALAQTMESCGIATSILNSQSYRDVQAAFFREPFSEKRIKVAAGRFSDLLCRRERLISILEQRGNLSAELYSINEKISQSLIKELVHHKLNGYYFLRSVDDSGDDAGYVLIMREIKHLPRSIARNIAIGLNESDARNMPFSESLCFDVDNFSMPIGELVSPYVEHVLQVFSSLFGRIGLKEHPKDYVDRICVRRPPVVAGEKQ